MFDRWRKMFENLDLPRLEVRLDFSPDVRLAKGQPEPLELARVRQGRPVGMEQPRESLLATERQRGSR